jgi:lactate dehydrogenase-like 2-hydroxyacid dehydrogenase
MKPAILIGAHFPERLLGRLADRYTLLGPLQRPGPDAVPPEAREARVLITLGGSRTDATLMDALPKLGLIACFGTGFEGVDRAAARARGIVVTHAGDTNSTAVAEFAMGLVIASARGIIRGDRYARAGRWRGDIIERTAVTPELAGRRLGIYGLGSIGSKVAQRAAAFEMEIGYHNRKPRRDVPYAYHPTLIGLAAWADILVVTVRADAGNRHAINREILTALGPEGHLVNVSRGIAVDEAALCDALEAGTIAGAALDVYEDEPHIPERLTGLDNVVLTPHMAAISANAQRAQRDIMFANLEAFFAGRPVLTPVPE